MFLLTVIGAKEDVTAGVVIIFGKAVTGPILCTADSTALKHVDQFHLHKLLKVVISSILGPTITRNVKNKGLYFVVMFCTHLLNMSDIFLHFLRQITFE